MPNPREAVALRALIARKRALARVVMVLERLWLLALPALGLVALFFVLAWFGYFRAVPDWLRIATLVVLAGGGLGSLAFLRRLRWPSERGAEDRLERLNALRHQALAVQNDRVETGGDFARALWEEHRSRMAARIAALQVGLPRPDTPRRDPFGVRAFVVLLLVTAFAYSYSNQAGRVSDAFVSNAVANAPAMRMDAWVNPPDYTRRAPIFLSSRDDSGQSAIPVPEGSEIIVRISGGADAETVTFAADGGAEPQPLQRRDGAASDAGGRANATGTDDARGYMLRAARSGALVVSGARGLGGTWRFRVVPDEPPEIALAGDPKATVTGAFEVPFETTDDYGVIAATAEFEPLDGPAGDARPLYGPPDYVLNLPDRGARSNRGVASHDLSAHPWAGSRVLMTLVAEDAAGQQGRSPARKVVLPQRTFHEPLARAIVEQRRILALDANAVPQVLRLMEALTTAPEETIDDLSHYLLLESARARIENARDDDMLREAADYLWDIALGIEDGDLSLAERRLRDAQRALAEALENDASDEEIQALMDELREAMRDYMQALARELQNSDQAMRIPPGAMENLLRQQDLEAMLDQIENLARQGAREEARQMLSQLQRMMNNLQAGRQPQAGDSPMRQQMDELGELMRQQQSLMDETFKLDQALRDRLQRGMPRQPGEQQNGGDQQGGLEQMSPEELEQALRQLQEQQQALQEELGALQEELEGMGIEPGEGFGQAGESMGDAARSLGRGRGEQAVGEQGQALEALRRGAQDMMNQMMQAMGQGQGTGQGQGPSRMRRSETDPLGRPRSTEGPDFGESVRVPDEIDIQRAREILEAIRDRLGNALSPEMERRYLERLLEIR